MSRLQSAFGASLRRVRTHQQLTQAQLAERIGRSTDLISRIERGDASPSFETIEKLSEVLSTPVYTLFGGPKSVDDHSIARSDVENLLLGMSTADLRWLGDLIKVVSSRPR